MFPPQEVVELGYEFTVVRKSEVEVPFSRVGEDG
jgi:hypothetical protein